MENVIIKLGCRRCFLCFSLRTHTSHMPHLPSHLSAKNAENIHKWTCFYRMQSPANLRLRTFSWSADSFIAFPRLRKLFKITGVKAYSGNVIFCGTREQVVLGWSWDPQPGLVAICLLGCPGGHVCVMPPSGHKPQSPTLQCFRPLSFQDEFSTTSHCRF